ncbi:MAG: DUF4097 family beta strand repeat-containing protein [Flavobacteriales bacterium]|nr:DUF4097 family beta strand repeat-containing protein [Flavobacteriales bacterium]
MKKKSIFSFFLAAILLSAEALALEDFSKEYRKSVKVNNNVIVDLEVNFADLKITTWDSPQIDIFVKITTNAKSQERADELFEKIEVAIGESMSKVDFKITSGSISCGKSENFSIVVEMKMPAGGSLEGNSAFGEMTLGDLSGNCNLMVEYGKFSGGNLSSSTNNFKVAFGDAVIASFGGGNLENEYGSLGVDQLKGNAEINVAFGDLRIGHVYPSCKNLAVRVEYGDADIGLDPSCAFSIDAESSYGEIDLPDGFKKTNSESDFASKHVEGSFGNSATGQLKIKSDFSDVEVGIALN